MKINFTKMHGLGNDFMVIDAINQSISLFPAQIKKLADRHFGVGFDQLLLVERAEDSKNDFKYRIFNADGSEVGQCGNGARCFTRFVIEKKLTNKEVGEHIFVETKEGVIELLVIDHDRNMTINHKAIWSPEHIIVMVDMGKPIWHPKDIPFRQLENDKATYTVENKEVGVVSIGNPHAVLIVDDINKEIEPIAKKIQSSADFPEGVNVNFVKIVDEFNIKLRVYERGVGETLACGSGACATVVYLGKKGKIDGKKSTIVEFKGGRLLVGFDKSILMMGPAESVFEGQVEV
ncbi:Diaminopimelate epimerase [hydrothermal vent metagenome]|uniref:diaminopimelate epimerase n=1 Tax=hydrothermal vent metagenome TaxID=652676 RepID=A0A1W1DU13_9ZZZZ